MEKVILFSTVKISMHSSFMHLQSNMSKHSGVKIKTYHKTGSTLVFFFSLTNDCLNNKEKSLSFVKKN